MDKMSIGESKYKNGKKIALFAIIAVMDILAFVAFDWKKYGMGSRVAILDVGQGDAAIIMGKNDNQILIDGGDGRRIMAELGKIMPFYDHTLEMIVITHPDSDHIAGLVDAVKYYNVKKVFRTEYNCDTVICNELEGEIRRKNIETIYAKFGQMIAVGDIRIKVISPIGRARVSKNDDNDNSIVLKIDVNGKSLLMMADAGYGIEKELIDSGVDIDSEILKVSHHGSDSATSYEFLEKVGPSEAIISVGKENKYGHPSWEVVSKLKNMNIKVKRTDLNGDIIIE